VLAGRVKVTVGAELVASLNCAVASGPCVPLASEVYRRNLNDQLVGAPVPLTVFFATMVMPGEAAIADGNENVLIVTIAARQISKKDERIVHFCVRLERTSPAT